MEQLIAAVMELLQEGGLVCVRQTPQSVMPQLRGPVTAVTLASAQAAEHALYEYLGQTPDGRSVYGRHLEARVRLTAVCPRALGSVRCQQEAGRAAELLSGRVRGVTLRGYTVDECVYDAGCDCFLCPVTAQVHAYVYATANEDETEFTDFILKGEIR